MTSYENARIVLLKSADGEKVYYIGTRSQDLAAYRSTLKHAYKKWKDQDSEKKTAERVEFGITKGDFSVELFEEYSCDTKKELDRRVKELNDEDEKSVCRAVLGLLSPEEREQLKLEKKRFRERLWYENNKEVLLEKKKEYYKKIYDKKLSNGMEAKKRGAPRKPVVFLQEE